MKLLVAARKIFLNDRRLQITLLAFMIICYGVILCGSGLHNPARLPKVYPLELTFNSMLEHLVHGQFDVDPNAILYEGFVRNGHVYSYFGITCALVRLPLLLLHRLDLNVTPWSCLIAVCFAGFMKVRAVLFVRRSCGITLSSELVFSLMLAYIVLGGAETAYLKSSIYQEVVFWAYAFGAFFVYFAVKGLVNGQFTVRTLSWMAFAAGFATLTRVSSGLGLSAAFGLLLLVLSVEEIRARHALLTRRFLIPIAILAIFFIAVGTVNYNRWGNPAAFTGGTYLSHFHDPDFSIQHTYGMSNLARLPFGIGYYFVPVWVLRDSDGQLLFASMQDRLMEFVDLPPGSFLLTELLPLVLIVFLAMALWNGRHSIGRSLQKGRIFARCTDPLPSFRLFSPARGLAIATGLAVPCYLMLTFVWMVYRYRMEFYPEIDLLAILSLYATVSDPALLAQFNRARIWMLAATAISILSAFASLFLYKLSNFDSMPVFLHDGIVHYFLYIWHNLHHGVGGQLPRQSGTALRAPSIRVLCEWVGKQKSLINLFWIGLKS